MTDTNDEERCCGSGTCLIDAQGRCWCGQQWDGKQMSRPEASFPAPASAEPPGAATMNNAKG